MLGLAGFLAIAALGAFLGWSRSSRLFAMALWWGLIVLGTMPGSPIAGIGTAMGGPFQLWILLGPAVALAMLYAEGLRRLKARAPAAVPPSSPAAQPAQIALETLERHSRHLLLHEIGGPGQNRLRAARILVVGAGGLGAPVLTALAAAGVGEIAVIDDDRVELSNLPRQTIHDTLSLGWPKVQSAAARIAALNPEVTVEAHERRLTGTPEDRALIAGCGLVIDGSDSDATRRLVNRLCAEARVPLIGGAIARWEGQISFWDPAHGAPCYECVFPEAPSPGMAPSCAEAGVVAPLPAVIGAIMALEAVKHLTGAGEGLAGRLLIFDALHHESRMIRVKPRRGCQVCGGNA